MAISPSGATVWRDYSTDGVPASGAHKVQKSQVRAWSQSVESLLDSVTTAAAIFDTRGSLFSTLTYAANTLAWVVSDGTAAYNGIYRKSGGTGTGSWARVTDLPYSFIVATDIGAGTPNAIQATSSIPVSESALVILSISEANTGSPVTVAFNGGSALAVKTNTGNDVAAGGLVAGMRLLGVVSGSTFRLVSDQVSSSIVAAAEAAQAAAEAAKTGAEDAEAGAVAAAAGVDLPPVAPNRMLVDNTAGTARESKTFEDVRDLLTSASERVEWIHKAALLDPAAYTYFTGNFDVTVPSGETWLVINAWWCNFGTSTGLWFHRNLKAHEAMELPAGTRIKNAHPSNASFLWVCRPALVSGNSQYLKPRDLYYDRISALRAIVPSQMTVTVPTGSARGTVVNQTLPTDFEDGVLLQVSTNDTAWTVLALPDGSGGANSLDEISDDHQMRLTGKMMVPFRRKLMPVVRARGASVSGDASETSLSNGHSVLVYQKLPSGFRTTPRSFYAESVLADNPLLYYGLDESTSATSAVDAGSAGIDASYVSPVALGAPGAPGDNGTACLLGTANNGRIEIPGGSGLNFSGDFTFEGWVNFSTVPNSASADPWVINGWTNELASPQSFLLAIYSQKLRFFWRNSVGTTFTVDSGITLAAGNYYHFVAGKDGGNIFVRIVSKETRKTTAVSGTMATLGSNKVQLGIGRNGGSFAFKMGGSIDEFAAYASALSDARADAHHSASVGWS